MIEKPKENENLQMSLDIIPEPKEATIAANKKIKVANEFINAQFKVDLLEFRTYLAIASSYNSNEKPENYFYLSFKASQLAKTIGIGIDRGYVKELERILTSLSQRMIRIQLRSDKDEEKEKWIKGHFISSIEAKGDGQIEIVMDPKLMKYFFNIQNQFSFLEIQTLLTFTSVYAIRIYNLLKQFSNQRKRIFKLEDLREMLLLQNKYPNFTDFNRYVLEPAVKNINELSTMQVRYETNGRKGVKITHVTFYYESINLIESPETDEKIKNALATLMINNIDRKVALDIIKKYNADVILKNIDYVLTVYKKRSKKDLAALIISAIKNDYVDATICKIDNTSENEFSLKVKKYIEELNINDKEKILKEIQSEHDNKGLLADLVKNKTFEEIYNNAITKGLVIEKIRKILCG